ncbi:hypoxanthine phosphoribosyltransferase [bacterium]|nr:hypoxanthine phosphoribosyltransferase [bacterium]
MFTTNEIKVLISKDDLYQKIQDTARKINAAYSKNETLDVICVLKGAVMFFSELIKYLEMPLRLHFVSLSSYGNERTSSGKITIRNLEIENLENKKVLIVEDIIDKGFTLQFLTDYFKTNVKPKSLKTVVLLNKKQARQCNIEPDFSCFEIDDKFVVGFGLDDAEKYRNLNYIGYVI